MSEKVLAEILETGKEEVKSARIVINVPAEKIFAILSNPHLHKEIDGTKTIQENISGPDKLVLGSKFGMKMRLGINYRIQNTVVEYEENSLIGWRHLGRWIWRYELVNIGPQMTQVTETFDASRAPLISKAWLSLRKAYPWTQKAVAKTLVQLKSTCEG
uniref:SRPBCC family protein n=1 Tax=Candidatus Planktophila sp. TaxID=2175601 RepID=UPI00404ACF80